MPHLMPCPSFAALPCKPDRTTKREKGQQENLLLPQLGVGETGGTPSCSRMTKRPGRAGIARDGDLKSRRRLAPPAGGPAQYSSGNRKVVTLRSASVMIQRQLSPYPLQGLAGSMG